MTYIYNGRILGELSQGLKAQGWTDDGKFIRNAEGQIVAHRGELPKLFCPKAIHVPSPEALAEGLARLTYFETSWTTPESDRALIQEVTTFLKALRQDPHAVLCGPHEAP